MSNYIPVGPDGVQVGDLSKLTPVAKCKTCKTPYIYPQENCNNCGKRVDKDTAEPRFGVVTEVEKTTVTSNGRSYTEPMVLSRYSDKVTFARRINDGR